MISAPLLTFCLAVLLLAAGSPPLQAQDSTPRDQIYYFPHLAVGASWQTTITYINYSREEVTCQTDFISDHGSPLMVSFAELGMVDSRTDVLPPGGSVHQETDVDLSAPLAPGWALANCSGPVQASLLFRQYDSEGMPVAEAGVNAATVPATRFVTFAEQGEGKNGTGVAYANPSDTAALVTFTARDADGEVLAIEDLMLPPNWHGAQNMPPLFDLSSFTGSIEVTSTEPIVSLSLNFEAASGFSSLPPGELDAAAQGSTTYYFPHLAVGASWQTTITYINYSREEVTCQTDFISDHGSPLMVSFAELGMVDSRTDVLPPGGSVHQETNVDLSAPLAPGWALANCTGPVQASLLFRGYNSEGMPVAEAGVNAATVPATRFVTFAEQGEGKDGTGVAYANPSDTAALVTFTARDADGEVLAIEDLMLPPNWHGAQNMPPLFDLSSFTGSLEVTSTEPIVSLSLNFEAAPVFSSLPPGEIPAREITASDAPDLVVQTPSVSDSAPAAGATFTLSATVRNVGDREAAATTLRYYRSNNTTISRSDTLVGTDAVSALSASEASAESIRLPTPSSAGIYYYGACVDPVSGESRIGNNCSQSVRLDTGTGTERSYVGQVRLACEDCGTFEDVDVVLSGAGVLETTTPNTYGQFAFFGLTAGNYIIQVRKPGFRSPPARSFRVDAGGQVLATNEEFVLYPLDSDTFVFHWEEDQSTAGYEYSAHVNEPLEVEFLDEEVTRVDSSSADQLLHDYNITLVNDGDNAWTHEHAYRLWQTMESIPQRKRDSYGEQSLPPSQWIMVSEHVADDIRIDADTNGSRTVSISVDAFVYATPRIARVEGKRGAYYSKRLHHALVRFVTDNGKDEDAYEKILQERFDVTTRITDHTTYRDLTANTTDEPAWRFQEFHAEEIVQIINTLEEMPAGMRAIVGLKYLVRRQDGTPHPLYPGAPAVAWTGSGYIEFMEHAFNTSSILSVHRLIIHEKAHFLWAYLFGDQLKEDWIELGGWYPDANDPDGWSTTKQTEFVNAYAHGKNPNEDMAESIAYFVINPDKLRSRSPGKYEFVRDRIMQGSFYISEIREDLTFEVYNLYPDYVYPGKIRRVDIEVTGAPEEDKKVRIEIELHALDGELEGAVHAFTRIFSEIGTFTDLYLYPVGVPRGQTGTVLSGSFTLSKYAKAGYWSPDQIRLSDAHSNRRFGGIGDFGWRLYANNPLEDVTPPQYVRNSLALSKSTEILEDREVQVIEATWEVVEDSGIVDCAGYLVVEIPGTVTRRYRRDGYSYRMGENYRTDPLERFCRARRIVPHYMPSGVYTVVSIDMRDVAGNWTSFKFRHPSNDPESEFFVDEAGPQIEMVTDNPDYETPELDLNNISIEAQPTRPDDPNGETLVTLKYRVRDNISGVTNAHIRLRDPQGVEHFFHMYPKVGYLHGSTWFPSRDPAPWSDETWTVLLPAGSAPGIWGVAEIAVWDRADNFKHYDFTEIIHFDVEVQ